MKVRASIVGLALLAACGGGGGGQAIDATMTAACDWTALSTSTASTYRKCQQVTGPRSEIEPELGSCAAGTDTAPPGVVRTTCPGTGGSGLVGCCSYPAWGLAMSWCYYDGAVYPDVESRCRSMTVNGDPAIWTTTVPIP